MEQNNNSASSGQDSQPIGEHEKSEVFNRVEAGRNERYRAALEATGIGTWDLDLLTNTVYWDDICKGQYGFHKDDIVPYDMVLNAIHPDDASKVDAAVKASLDPIRKALYDIVFRTIGVDDNKLRWLHCMGKARFNEEGHPVRFTGTSQDVTRYQLQQQQLEVSEARYRDMIENSPIGKAIFTSRDMIIDMVNDAMLEIWGKDRSIIGRPLTEVMPELKEQRFFTELQEVYETGIPFSTDEGLAYLSKYGGKPTPHWFQYSYRALYDVEGKIHGIINTVTEITSVVQAKQAAKDTSEELIFILDAASLGTWCLDVRINKVFFDERAKELLGYPVSGSIDLDNALTTIFEEDKAIVSHAIENAFAKDLSDGAFDVEQRTLKGNKWLRVKGKAIFDTEGKPIQMSGIVIDITPQKELQTIKDDFIKMASHELKTPLASAIAYAQILEMELSQQPENGKANMMIGKLKSQIKRLDSLVGDLLDASKMKVGGLDYEETEFDFDELVNAAIEEVQVITSTHQIEKHLQASCAVYGDKNRIRQVVINLITNAIKYSPNAHAVIVSTNLKEDEITLCVEDFGIGIPKAKQAKVFEQFYRVRKDQRIFPGLGLGLYISSQIIQNTEGKIWIAASDEGKGSTFCFALPSRLQSRDS